MRKSYNDPLVQERSFENPEEKANFREIYRYDLQVPKNFIQYYNIAEFFTRKKGEKLAGEVLEQDFYGVGIHGKTFCHCS